MMQGWGPEGTRVQNRRIFWEDEEYLNYQTLLSSCSLKYGLHRRGSLLLLLIEIAVVVVVVVVVVGMGDSVQEVVGV